MRLFSTSCAAEVMQHATFSSTLFVNGWLNRWRSEIDCKSEGAHVGRR